MFYTYCSNKHARGEGNTEALLLRNPNQLEKQDIQASHSYLAPQGRRQEGGGHEGILEELEQVWGHER